MLGKAFEVPQYVHPFCVRVRVGESKNPRGAGSCYLGWVSSTEKERPSSSSATHSDESLRNLPGQEVWGGGKKIRLKQKQNHQHKVRQRKSVTKKHGLKNKWNKISVRHNKSQTKGNGSIHANRQTYINTKAKNTNTLYQNKYM